MFKQEFRKVRVTAHCTFKGATGIHELGHTKRKAHFFPNQTPVELEVSTVDEPLLDQNGAPEVDVDEKPIYRLLADLTKLRRNPHLTVEVLKNASELESELHAVREAEAKAIGKSVAADNKAAADNKGKKND